MDNKRKRKIHISKSTPPDASHGAKYSSAFSISTKANSSLIIDGFDYIYSYTERGIVFSCDGCLVKIAGNSLEISTIGIGAAHVTGDILSIEFINGGDSCRK